MSKYKAGEVYKVNYPFRLDINCPWGSKWAVGVRSQDIAPDDSELVADGMGKMIITIVDVHRPGKFPTRVFFTRQWADPDGNIFGKGGLHIRTTAWLSSRLSGYLHEFRMSDEEDRKEYIARKEKELPF